MSDNLRAQIYNHLIIQNTEQLLEIWQNGDPSEWSEDVFELAKDILIERLGYVPPQSLHAQVLRILRNVERYIDRNELDIAFSECERVIQMDPHSSIAYNYRGEIYDQQGELGNAIADYQRAIQLDSELEQAWENLLSVESELDEEFKRSVSKRHLDQALEYAYSGEPDKALEECETARSTLPGIAMAYNYRGLILQTLDQLEPAIASYLQAIQLNPRFYAARENLANARVRWEEEQYLRITNLATNENKETGSTNAELVEPLDSVIGAEQNPVPGWVYLEANAFLLIGWAGYRNRPGRSGYDPLETDFELAHVQGVVLRRLITCRFRTRNPIYLLLMACMGISYSGLGILAFTRGNWAGIVTGILYSPYWIAGIALLINVYLSLQLERPSEDENNGYTFF